MQLENTARPVPAACELLIRVYAAGVNAVDCAIRNGFGHFKSMYMLPFTPGCDGAGIVEAVGSKVTGFKKGDAVYGTTTDFPGGGSYAEYCVAEASSVYPEATQYELQ